MDKWLKRETRWCLFSNVPGLLCDQCGEAIWEPAAVQKLVGMVNGHLRAQPTGAEYFPIFDLDRITSFVSDGTLGAMASSGIYIAETPQQFWYVNSGVGPAWPQSEPPDPSELPALAEAHR